MGKSMTVPIRIVIADDHVLLLDGMHKALDSLPDMGVVATATDGQRLAEVLRQMRPDVLLVDIEMPHGTGLDVLQSLDDPPPTLVVTMHTEDRYRKKALDAGASGFLSKSTPLPELAAAVRAVHDGVDLFAHDDLTVALVPYREATLDPGAESLTAREREILALLARGISRSDALAEALYISLKRVMNRLASIYAKLHVADRALAAGEAFRLGRDNR